MAQNQRFFLLRTFGFAQLNTFSPINAHFVRKRKLKSPALRGYKLWCRIFKKRWVESLHNVCAAVHGGL